ncbi:hypothetical protein [uncultured Enterococcus sp.]|jgi:hypothetical protein|uniref:hypothetical protein n=1 Tax=uncultured Enterococcus sp. TaxID=167972 RepID=UPI00205D9563|nr:hypothetical protein [uncultured Enterococcus sp.]DAL95831.1 MAG TPA: hypothetical protein [Caudoviricetes sp.]
MNIQKVLKEDVVEELKSKGFNVEEIQQMKFEDMVNNLYHPTYKLEVENKYDESVLYSNNKIISNDDYYMYTLPNGTLVVTDPKLTKYIERSVRNATNGNPYYVGRCKGAWVNDQECIEYEQNILRKRGK